MEYKVLGVKFNVVNVVVCVALGFLICAMIGCDCINMKTMVKGKEGFVSGSSCTKNNINVASPLAPLIGATPSMDAAAPLKKGDKKAPMVASVEGQKMFYLNEHDVDYKPECCMKSVYSNSMGCACLNDNQWNFLNKRGGNRTMGPTEF
jgi:hypothetical protein